MRLLASCIEGEVASIFHSSGYTTLIVHYIRIYGNVNRPWFRPRPRRFTAINSDVVDNNYNVEPRFSTIYELVTLLNCQTEEVRHVVKRTWLLCLEWRQENNEGVKNAFQ